MRLSVLIRGPMQLRLIRGLLVSLRVLSLANGAFVAYALCLLK